MATVTLSASDIQKAEEFVASFLAAENPDADYSKGSTLRDLAVRGIAISYAYLTSLSDKVRTLSRIKEIAVITDDEERAEAIINFSANFFLTPRAGRYAQGLVDIYFDKPVFGVVPSASIFTFNSTINYVLNNLGQPLIFDTGDLTTVSVGLGGNTQVLYTLRVPIIALKVGTSSHIVPQVASNFTRFLAEIVKVESIEPITNGSDVEDADVFLERIPNAITVRNLLTERSITTVLTEGYPQISSLTVIGAEDSEMTRDISPISTEALPIHTGGSVDIFVDTGIITTVFEGLIGSPATERSPLITVFRDLQLIDMGVDWRGMVEPGDTLRIYNTEGSEPSLYLIHNVSGYFLRVQDLLPFKTARPVILHNGTRYEECTLVVATLILTVPYTKFTSSDIGNFVYLWAAGDAYYKEIKSIVNLTSQGYGDVELIDVEGDLATFATSGISVSAYDSKVEYSIGDDAPTYANKMSKRDFGQITRSYFSPDGVILTGLPIYKIHSVTLVDTTNLAASAEVGGASFVTRVNVPPEMKADKTLNYEYQAISFAPNYHQSTKSSTLIRVGPVDSRGGNQGSLAVTNAATRQGVFSSLAPDFTVADVGLEILVTKAFNPGNAGLYTIDSVIDSKNVNVTKNSRHYDPDALANEINLTWEVIASSRVSGLLRVTYDTLSNFSSLAAYVQDSPDRVVASSPLVKGYHPVYLSMSLNYTVKTGEDPPDENQMKASVVDFVNNFLATDVLNVGDITSYLRRAFTSIGNILQPVKVDYTLYSPTGDAIVFTTYDIVEISSTSLLSASDSALYSLAKKYGVSDRTVRYVCTRSDISLLKV